MSESKSNVDLGSFYTKEWYTIRVGGSRESAKAILPLVFGCHAVSSVVDVGCGAGAWLAVAKGLGATEIQGIDGDYVNRANLEIPLESFRAADITLPISLGRKYDLAMCLEVGEHLPDASAATLVKSLVDLSDVVVFSAAVPGQGGTNHVNEQWPAYWAQLFGQHKYRALDFVRPAVWSNPGIDWWYAQNTIIYVSPAAYAANPKWSARTDTLPVPPLALVHPRSFARLDRQWQSLSNLQAPPNIPWSLRALGLAVRAAISRRLNPRKPGAGPKKG